MHTEHSPQPEDAAARRRPGRLAHRRRPQPRLTRIQRQPALIAGFLGQTGLTLESQPP